MSTPFTLWEDYLDYLAAEYKKDLKKWEKEAVKKVEEYEARPWYQKIMHSKEDIIMWHEWEKPYKGMYEPTIVGYNNWHVGRPNWDVTRKKTKNART